MDLMPPLPMRPVQRAARRPRPPIPSRPINSGAGHDVSGQSRDRNGRWVDMFQRFTRPQVSGPRKLTPLINRSGAGSRRGASRWQRVVKVVSTIRHPYKTWRKTRVKQLKRQAKQQRRSTYHG